MEAISYMYYLFVDVLLTVALSQVGIRPYVTLDVARM